jgi:hypothetical protein
VVVPVGFAGYYGFFFAVGVLSVALVVFAVEMLRAQVLPVVPIILLALGPAILTLSMAVLALVPGDAGVAVLVALVPTTAALMWLGWVMWREPAVDRRGVEPLAAT